MRNPAASALFGIKNLEAVEAITLGLSVAEVFDKGANKRGDLSYTNLMIKRLMHGEPKPVEKKPIKRNILRIGPSGGVNAHAVFQIEVEHNEYGESIAHITRNAGQSTTFGGYIGIGSSASIKFENKGILPRKGGEKDPRAWPIRVFYEGHYDRPGNGHWTFNGQFEYNAFGYFKSIEYEQQNLSLGENWGVIGQMQAVHLYSNNLNYNIPPLPEPQRKILNANLKYDPNYEGFVGQKAP